MRQSRYHSALESLANVAVGYTVGLVSQWAVFPLFDIHISLADNLGLSAWFTAISLARSYVLRRWFTRRTEAHGLRWRADTGELAPTQPQRAALDSPHPNPLPKGEGEGVAR